MKLIGFEDHRRPAAVGGRQRSAIRANWTAGNSGWRKASREASGRMAAWPSLTSTDPPTVWLRPRVSSRPATAATPPGYGRSAPGNGRTRTPSPWTVGRPSSGSAAIARISSKDQLMSAYGSADLPVPAVRETGRAGDGYFAVSDRAPGRLLNDLDRANMRAALPGLLRALDALRAIEIPPPAATGSGYPMGPLPPPPGPRPC
jgi:hypothetical protein